MSRLTHAGYANLSTISELFNCAASSSSLYAIAAFGSNTLGLCAVKLMLESRALEALWPRISHAYGAKPNWDAHITIGTVGGQKSRTRFFSPLFRF
jgi:hypothetical protein